MSADYTQEQLDRITQSLSPEDITEIFERFKARETEAGLAGPSPVSFAIYYDTASSPGITIHVGTFTVGKAFADGRDVTEENMRFNVFEFERAYPDRRVRLVRFPDCTVLLDHTIRGAKKEGAQ